MGKIIHHLAEVKGHEIAVVIDSSDARSSSGQFSWINFAASMPLIDFTTADAVRRNVEACLL